jgi:hypothetical protein
VLAKVDVQRSRKHLVVSTEDVFERSEEASKDPLMPR